GSPWSGAACLLAATLVTGTMAAQQIDPRLDRLDAVTRSIVGALVDSAVAAALPTEPLIQRALEGATKRATGEVIVAAVRRLAQDLAHARDALGGTASPGELTAGAAALPAGAQATGNVDVAVSTVRYDGFLPSGAASLTPAVSWERPGATITARGTYLRFESGRRSLHGILAASVLTPRPLLPAPWRGELTV